MGGDAKSIWTWIKLAKLRNLGEEERKVNWQVGGGKYRKKDISLPFKFTAVHLFAESCPSPE